MIKTWHRQGRAGATWCTTAQLSRATKRNAPRHRAARARRVRSLEQENRRATTTIEVQARAAKRIALSFSLCSYLPFFFPTHPHLAQYHKLAPWHTSETREREKKKFRTLARARKIVIIKYLITFSVNVNNLNDKIPSLMITRSNFCRKKLVTIILKSQNFPTRQIGKANLLRRKNYVAVYESILHCNIVRLIQQLEDQIIWIVCFIRLFCIKFDIPGFQVDETKNHIRKYIRNSAVCFAKLKNYFTIWLRSSQTG